MNFKFVLPVVYINSHIQTKFEVNQTQIRGGGGDNRSNFTKICNLTSLGSMMFRLSKNQLKSKRKLSNFHFRVPH